MTISQTHATPLPGVQVHRAPVRPAETSSEPQNDRSGRNMTRDDWCGNDCLGPNGHAEGCPVHCGCYDTPPRRMIAVTVALSEPADCGELDWADTIAANLRLIYGNTTVEIIDTWRVDA